MKRKLLFALCVLLALLSCKERQPVAEEDVPGCSCPHCVICIQPYNGFTVQEAKKLVPKLEKEFGEWLFGGWEFKVMESKNLPKEAFVADRNRYKAWLILDSLKKNPKKDGGIDVVYIGLTHEDICADIHGVKDYGIIGYSYSPSTVCVVSDKRLKDKSQVWKPMLHEFMHAFYGAKHCPKDDPTCFMKDAKGHGTFNVQNKLCDSCKRRVNSQSQN